MSSSDNPGAASGDEVNGVFRKEIDDLRKAWGNSTQGKAWRNALRATKPGDNGVTEAICLGIGRLTAKDMDARIVSLRQLAVLLESVKALDDTEEIPIYFQDPAFTSSDKELLEYLGYSVAFDNRVSYIVQDSSLLYTPACSQDAVFPLFAHVRPAVWISNDWFKEIPVDAADTIRQSRKLETFCEKEFRAFVQSLESFKVKVGKEGLWGWMFNYKAYWRANEGTDGEIAAFYKWLDQQELTPVAEDDFRNHMFHEYDRHQKAITGAEKARRRGETASEFLGRVLLSDADIGARKQGTFPASMEAVIEAWRKSAGL